MATLKRWSRTVGTRRGNRIRVYEREPGGKLYAAVWDPERHKYTQTGLGHRDHERALRDVGELVRLRESGDDLSGPLKLGTMVARDRKSTRLNSSHMSISYAVFCLKKKKKKI